MVWSFRSTDEGILTGETYWDWLISTLIDSIACEWGTKIKAMSQSNNTVGILRSITHDHCEGTHTNGCSAHLSCHLHDDTLNRTK